MWKSTSFASVSQLRTKRMEGPSSTVERQEKIVDCLWLEGKKFKRDLFGAGELELDTVEETCAS